MSARPLLVLASSSPRRLALLRQIGIEPDRVTAPEVEEAEGAREPPRAHALRLARAKAEAVAARDQERPSYVLAADTVVACGRRILPKAQDLAAAERCLRLLSGRRHRVYTAVAVHAPDGRATTRIADTMVQFRRLHEDELQAYLDSHEWQGKAGAYAIQGRAEAFVVRINGCYSNVVGLPLYLTVTLLRGLGWQPS